MHDLLASSINIVTYSLHIPRIYHHGGLQVEVEVKCSTTRKLINRLFEKFIVDIQVMITLPLSL